MAHFSKARSKFPLITKCGSQKLVVGDPQNRIKPNLATHMAIKDYCNKGFGERCWGKGLFKVSNYELESLESMLKVLVRFIVNAKKLRKYT